MSGTQCNVLRIGSSNNFGRCVTEHRPNAPAFSMVLAGLAAYVASDPASVPTAADKPNLYLGNMEAVDQAIMRRMSSLAVIVALVYCHQHDKAFTPPDPARSYISNLLLMMGFVGKDSNEPEGEVLAYLERLWVLYADGRKGSRWS